MKEHFKFTQKTVQKIGILIRVQTSFCLTFLALKRRICLFFAFSERLFLANFALSLDNFLNKGEKRLKTEVKNPRRTSNASARKNQSLF